MMPIKNKYNNHTFVKDGIRWHSEVEYYRWLWLLAAQRSKKIMNLRRQVSYEILPDQWADRVKQLKTKVKITPYLVEHKVEYVADFVYEKKDGTTVIEDVKSPATRKKESYVIKRKLMRLQGHPIREVFNAGEDV